jgi:hypothetical protein
MSELLSGPCNPRLPRISVEYNKTAKLVEVGFGGNGVTTYFPLTADQATCLLRLLAEAVVDADLDGAADVDDTFGEPQEFVYAESPRFRTAEGA